MAPIINKETVDAIQAALTPVAEKIGEGAAYVWTTVVTQQYVVGISYCIWAGATLIGAIIMVLLSKKAWKLQQSTKTYDSESTGWDVAAVFAGIATMVLSVTSVICLTQGVMHLINPGYYALEFFIQLGRAATTAQ